MPHFAVAVEIWSRGPELVGKKCLCCLPGISKHIINKLRAPGSSAAPRTVKAISLSFFNVFFSLLSSRRNKLTLGKKQEKNPQVIQVNCFISILRLMINNLSSFLELSTFFNQQVGKMCTKKKCKNLRKNSYLLSSRRLFEDLRACRQNDKRFPVRSDRVPKSMGRVRKWGEVKAIFMKFGGQPQRSVSDELVEQSGAGKTFHQPCLSEKN